MIHSSQSVRSYVQQIQKYMSCVLIICCLFVTKVVLQIIKMYDIAFVFTILYLCENMGVIFLVCHTLFSV